MKGKVYLVGAGPGKPDLITVRGFNILKEADVVIYDYLVDKSLLEYVKESAELICCNKLGKEDSSNGSLRRQHRINNLLIKKTEEGKKIVRLKNGDPSIFSKFSQELDALVKAEIEFEIVPGVNAASAASCFSGFPLTDRRFASSCVFVTGHEDPKKRGSLIDWQVLAKNGTVALYMAVENLNTIIKKIIEAGKDKNTPCAIIQNASLLTQKILIGTLTNIVAKAQKERLRSPAIVVIGKVVEMEKQFNWLKRNRKILFTGLSKDRFFKEGTYFYLPLIRIKPLEDYNEFDSYLKKIRTFNWIVFTSRYGVEYFFKRLNSVGYDSRVLHGIKIAAIGNSTKNRLIDFGIGADLIPKEESSKGLLKKFKEENLKGKNVFLPRSDISDKGLEKGLKDYRANVKVSFAYRNVMPEDLPDLNLNYFDEIMFTSPSTVRNFKRRYKRIPKGVKINCIGDVTLKEAKRCRLLD